MKRATSLKRDRWSVFRAWRLLNATNAVLLKHQVWASLFFFFCLFLLFFFSPALFTFTFLFSFLFSLTFFFVFFFGVEIRQKKSRKICQRKTAQIERFQVVKPRYRHKSFWSFFFSFFFGVVGSLQAEDMHRKRARRAKP